MGLIRDALSKSIEIVREEILPLRTDLIKAGILKPEPNAYDPKASLVDPWAYGSVATGYKEKYSILDYSKCRTISYADPIVASVIQTRLNQVAACAIPQQDRYKVGFKIKCRNPDQKPTSQDKKRMKEIEQFLVHCGVPENFDDTPDLKRRDNFETFLRKIARDSLTFDQINFEVSPRKNGRPYSFQAIDAGTIRLIQDKKELLEQGQANAQYDPAIVMDLGSKDAFNEFKPKHPRYAQVMNGVVRHVFDEWEMAFGVRNPRTDLLASGYGFSEIEMLVTTITAHMNAETYNRKFFSQGSSIKGILSFEGVVPPDQLEAFRRQWYQQVSGVQNAWKTPILSLGKDSKLNWTSLHANNSDMEFGSWLDYCIKTICGVFQIDPMEIGFDIAKQSTGEGTGSGMMGGGQQAERLMFSQDKGLRPLLRHIQTLINDYIIFRLDPNYEFEFVGMNTGSEKDDLDRAVQQVKAFKTINEIRTEHDLKPLPPAEKIKSIGDIVLDSNFMQFLQSQAQQQGMGPDGQPLGPDGKPQPPGVNEDGEAEDDGSGGGQGKQEEEPDYDNMSLDELQDHLSQIQSPDQDQEAAPKSAPKKSGSKPKPKKPAFAKSLELEL